MPTGKLFIAVGIAFFLLSACVPLPQYMKVASDLDESQSGKDDLVARLKQAEDKINRMDLALRDCEASRKVKAQNDYLKNINQQLLQNTRRLKKELYKKKSVIQLQGKVIQLLDDTKKTIETSLKDQIAAQEIEVVEEDDKLKVIFVDKILFRKCENKRSGY